MIQSRGYSQIKLDQHSNHICFIIYSICTNLLNWLISSLLFYDHPRFLLTIAPDWLRQNIVTYPVILWIARRTPEHRWTVSILDCISYWSNFDFTGSKQWQLRRLLRTRPWFFSYAFLCLRETCRWFNPSTRQFIDFFWINYVSRWLRHIYKLWVPYLHLLNPISYLHDLFGLDFKV